MAGTNDFQLFAVGGSANVLTQSAYAGRSELQNGVQSGQASSQLYNKHARQASIMASMIGQFIVNQTGGNAVDDGTTATLINQFIQAIQASTRIRLTQDTTFYVNPSSGSDFNNGLSQSSPFKTVQGAVNAIYTNYDLARHQASINLANGNYTSAASGQPVLLIGGRPVGSDPAGYAPIQITGNPSTPSSVTFQGTNASAVVSQYGAMVALSGISFSSTGTGVNGSGIAAQSQGGILINGNCNFASCGGPQVFSTAFSDVFLQSNYTISGNAGSHMSAVAGFISISGLTGTVTGNPSFAVFANSDTNGVITQQSSSYGGNCTGARYRCALGGVISTGSGNASFFPGSTAGTVDAYSIYT